MCGKIGNMNDEFWLARVKIAKKKGQKVGLVQGSWDLFHIGHLRYILKARELCDFLVVAMDGDEKIRKRKGPTRPVIPETERHEFIKLLDIADTVVVKDADEPKWHLIKTIRPDVLIAIAENYTEQEIEQLHEFCGVVQILPRQAKTSTSSKIRQVTINNKLQYHADRKRLSEAILGLKKRIDYTDTMSDPIKHLVGVLERSTDEIVPTSACCEWNGGWVCGTNQVDPTIPQEDIDDRTELFYDTVEHAEINMLKQMGEVRDLSNTPIYTTLFPCDKCMKALADKGVKEIYYLEDHPHRNWSARSHELANKKGIHTECLI